jgi:hypothetical protein
MFRLPHPAARNCSSCKPSVRSLELTRASGARDFAYGLRIKSYALMRFAQGKFGETCGLVHPSK